MKSLLRILMVGAHPDDAEIHFGGLAALYARQGHRVTLLSMTDGGAGHQTMPRRALAVRRRHEARAAASVLSAESIIMPFPDCRLEPSMRVREAFIRVARNIAPDIIFTHTLPDYHPDHGATVQVIFDSAYLLSVPHVVPALRFVRTPVICQSDRGLDAPGRVIVVPIDAVWQLKILAMHQHASQMYEWLPWTDGMLKQVPPDKKGRLAMLEQQRGAAARRIADWGRQHSRHRKGTSSFRYAEAVYAAPAGLALTPERRAILFPFAHFVIQSNSRSNCHERGYQ